jgi:hypothetical protein
MNSEAIFQANFKLEAYRFTFQMKWMFCSVRKAYGFQRVISAISLPADRKCT